MPKAVGDDEQRKVPGTVLFGENGMAKYAELTQEETDALVAFAKGRGRFWKRELQNQWMYALATPVLHRLRNTHGPSWLVKYRLPKEG